MCIRDSAQTDAHYWTHQYGAKGLLLNGAVVASPSGETSIFYNPGSMGMDENLGFAFSFVTPTYSDLRTRNLLGNGNVIIDNSAGLSPGFLGVRFRPFTSKLLTVGISQFRRFRTDISHSDRVVSQVNNLSELVFRADLDYNRRLAEQWVGLGLALNIDDIIGIGISQFTVWHNQNTDIDLKKEIQLSDDPSSVFQSSRYESEYGFNLHSGFITKLGFSYKSSVISLGLTYTSPAYGFIRRIGNYNLENHIIDNVNEKFSSTSNREEIRDITYKTPHSFAIGVDFHHNKTDISITTEYFTGIDEYQIINALDDSFDGLSQVPSEIPFLVESANEAVLNLAIGLQKEASEKTTWVFGFRTDFNQNTSLNINGNPGSYGQVGDVYHLSGGTMLNFKQSKFSCGIDLGVSRRTGGQQLVDLEIVDPSTVFEFSESRNVESRFFSAVLFLTYDFISDKFSGKSPDN